MSSPRRARAVEIVVESLGATDAQALRNTATALATIGTPDCAVRLAELALDTDDRSVYERVTEELASLDEPARRAAAERALKTLLGLPADVDSTLTSSEWDATRESRARANELLADLRRQGVKIALPTAALPKRFAIPSRLRPLLEWFWTLRRYFPLFWKLRWPLARRHPPPPLWRSASSSFAGAFAGAVLTALLFALWEPRLSQETFLAISLPATLLATFLVTANSRATVPVERYGDARLGTAVETVGFLWRPAAGTWRSLLMPLSIAGVTLAALFPLRFAFGGLDLGFFGYVAWSVASFAGLLLGFAVLRGIAAAAAAWGRVSAAVAGGAAGLVLGLAALAAFFLVAPGSGTAVLVAEAAVLALPLVSAFVFERGSIGPAAARARPTSRTTGWAMAALVIALSPGAWLFFNPPLVAPRGETVTRSWWLAQIPVERSFRVEFPQRVWVRVLAEDAPDRPDLVLRLTLRGETIEGEAARNGTGWDLPAAEEDYRLEVTHREGEIVETPLDFLVRESYVSAVALLARELLELRGRHVPPNLAGVFGLELVLNAEPTDDPGR